MQTGENNGWWFRRQETLGLLNREGRDCEMRIGGNGGGQSTQIRMIEYRRWRGNWNGLSKIFNGSN